MRANVEKTEKKTLFGGTKYRLAIKLELADDERVLLEKHHLGRFRVVEQATIDRFSASEQIELMNKGTFALHFIKGFSHDFSTLAKLANFEAGFYEGCRGLKQQIEALKSHADDMGARSVEF